MKKLTLLYCMIFLILNSYGQKNIEIILNTKENNENETDYYNYKQNVQKEMDEWFKKGDLEKKSEYLERIKKTNSVFIKLKKKELKIDNYVNLQKISYDIEEEKFKLKLKNFKQFIIIKINRKFSDYAFWIRSPQMIIHNNEFIIIKGKIVIEKEGEWYLPRKYVKFDASNEYTPDPELTLADLNLDYLPEDVKAIVFNQPKTIIPAVVHTANLQFKTPNNTLTANQNNTIQFTLNNSGKGAAKKLSLTITDANNTPGISFKKDLFIGDLEPNASKEINIPITANLNLTTSTANFNISFNEENGFYPDPIHISLPTLAFKAPKLQIVDHSFLSQSGKLEKAKPIVLKALIQNLGQGNAENIQITFKYPSTNVFNTSPNTINISQLTPNQSQEISFEFLTNKNYTATTIPITIDIQEVHKKFAENKNVVANLSENVATTLSIVAKNDPQSATPITPVSLSSDVDKNIPQNPTKNHNKYALIIGNEDYSSRQTNLHKENNVPFAINDAKTFKDYCVQSLGIDESNVFLLFNATAGEMTNKIQVLTEILKRLGNKAELIVYYAGHGFPDEKTKAAYLIPVDVSPNNLNSAIKLQDLYNKLSATKAAKINFFIDACFTGGGREESLVSGARGIKIVPNEDALTGNVVVFSATTNDQTALPFKDKQHGMFTYYILKALQNAKGKIKFADLERYVKENVAIQSLKINAKEQDPTIKVSPAVKNTYLNWEF
ncbi:MAG: caspase family protein [Alphaproteobacteria bacterium]|nr:caspase family protein [Alphaproteobacteria bacterium]